MRARFAVLIVFVVANATYAGDVKKAGAELQKRGVTTYEIVTNTAGARGGRSVALTLFRGAAKFATVTVDEIAGNDHILKIEPATGEALIVEAWMSKGELTYRSGDESVTSRFDVAEKKWKRTGSEALFQRGKELSELAALIVVELQERRVLRSAGESDSATEPAPPGGSASNSRASPASARPCIGGNTFTQDPGDAGDVGAGHPCTGPAQNCYGYDSMASRACKAAREQCAVKCWNEWCIGCCKYDECNKICSVGDFWCAASIDGYTCTYSDVH